MTHEPVRLPPLRILLAEDSYVNQRLVVALMEKHGHDVTVAENGKAAIEALVKSQFDLVLMDVEMPEMNGLEATAVIRSKETQTGAHVPIVAMTAHAMKGDRERCLAAGMDDYVSKPINADQVFDKISQVLQLGHTLENQSAPSIPSREGPDWNEALALVEGDRNLLQIVVETTLRDAPRQMALMREALDDRDAEALGRTAHTLQGSLSYFGSSPSLKAALKIVELARHNKLDDVGPLIATLGTELNCFLRHLEEFL